MEKTLKSKLDLKNKQIIEPVEHVITYVKIKFFNSAALFFAGAGWAYSWIAPAGPFVVAVMVLTILDMITGVQAAKVRIRKFKKENPGEEPIEKISSRGLYRTSQKIVVYVCGILGCHILHEVFVTGLPFDIPIVYMATFPMVWTELKSMSENIMTVTGVDIAKTIDQVKEKLLNSPKE